MRRGGTAPAHAASEGKDTRVTVLDQPAPPLAPDPLPPPAAPPERSGLVLAGQMLGILGAVLLCFVAQLVLFGALKHERDQNTAYTDFRARLANAVAPVGGLADGRLLASGTPVAILEIPRFGIQEVVSEGTSARTLKSGPGHVRNTPLPGQPGTSVIYGRKAAYGGPFAMIDMLRSGDLIIVTTGQGESRYSVQGVRRANDKERPAPGAGKGRLTLATADGSFFLPTDVLRVDATLTTEVRERPGSVPAFAVPDDERAMAGDESALVPIALWTLILAAAAVAVVYVRQRVGRWHAWVIGIPVLGVLGVTLADQAAALLPNLM
ncbi:class E sortase [Actinokineospora sp. NBRC 105648]|uniref:sortase n=1 Tax=Actinokineospora sp. NBRC 105648 TaxID=3032206 RepID=UPI0024A1FB9A|nr:class E sortase [Actinokineospora sp. NBRC 105648]GLZ41001.1 sortase [Actinokineospora sp. NBRC 105648]